MEDYWERCCFDWEEIPNTIYDSFWDDMYYEYTYPPEFYTPFNLMSPHPNWWLFATKKGNLMQLTKGNFNGIEKKIQKAAQQHILNEDQERFKSLMGEDLYKDVVHFARFNGNFERSRVFKRMLDQIDESTFDETEDPLKGISERNIFMLDPLLVHSIRQVYSIFSVAAGQYKNSNFDRTTENLIRRLKLYQTGIKEKMQL